MKATSRSPWVRISIAVACAASTATLWSCSGSFAWFGAKAPSYDMSHTPDGPGPGPGPITDTWTDIHPFQVFDGRITRGKATQDAPRYNLVWGSGEPSRW